MLFESRELQELWKSTDALMKIHERREQMSRVGYFSDHHDRFKKVAEAKHTPDIQVLHHELAYIFTPLKSFFISLRQMEKLNSNRVKGMDDKVQPIFDTIQNADMKSLKSRYEQAAAGHKELINKCNEGIKLIEFIMANPLFKNHDPAFDERGMSM